jgi:hypothetical protein
MDDKSNRRYGFRQLRRGANLTLCLRGDSGSNHRDAESDSQVAAKAALLSQIHGFLHDLVGHRDHPRIGLITALERDDLRQLRSQVNIGLFKR